MSEYQYYEFCSVHKPLSPKAREEMASLSSRAKISTHGASYVYNYGDFKGEPKKLVLKYFDVFFYISNFGDIRLLFKYPVDEVKVDQIKKYSIKNFINVKIQKEYVLLDIEINFEEGLEWLDGEEMFVNLLPLYDEIKAGSYQFLELISVVHEGLVDEENMSKDLISNFKTLSSAQKSFLECMGLSF